jgi:uncharacterized protein
MTAALPHAIDLRALAHRGETESGAAPLSAFGRLLEGAPVPDADLAPVNWTARAEWREPVAALAGTPGTQPQLWLHLQLGAEVPQTCQRCLGAYAQAVEVDRWFRFVADETTAEAQDDESEEDLLVLEPRFDLVALIEDELLLALPLVPMHEVCPQPLRMSAGELPEEEGVPHPFAALARLKGRGSES